jgi:hypothetical protein
MNVFCFAEREHAVQFREHFGGEFIDPKKMPQAAGHEAIVSSVATTAAVCSPAMKKTDQALVGYLTRDELCRRLSTSGTTKLTVRPCPLCTLWGRGLAGASSAGGGDYADRGGIAIDTACQGNGDLPRMFWSRSARASRTLPARR